MVVAKYRVYITEEGVRYNVKSTRFCSTCANILFRSRTSIRQYQYRVELGTRDIENRQNEFANTEKINKYKICVHSNMKQIVQPILTYFNFFKLAAGEYENLVTLKFILNVNYIMGQCKSSESLKIQ